MDEALDPEMLESLEMMLNWDLLTAEADWDVIQALDNTPVPAPKAKPKPAAAKPGGGK